MKRIVVMALLALTLPVAAFANSVDFGSKNGKLTESSTGVTLSGSQLKGAYGWNSGIGILQGNLGTVNISTASMTASSSNGATFATGGSIVLNGNGKQGIPNGVIFTGSFIDPVHWDAVYGANGKIVAYTMTGDFMGKWFNGSKSLGIVSEWINVNPHGKVTGIEGWLHFDSAASMVPEPGTLGLLGTGLVGVAGLVRRKMKS